MYKTRSTPAAVPATSFTAGFDILHPTDGASYPPFGYFSLQESISYDIGDRNVTHFCDHVKTSMKLFTSYETIHDVSGSGWTIQGNHWFNWDSGWCLPTWPVDVVDASQLAPYIFAAQKTALASMNTGGNSLLNFIIELKDLKRTADMWRGRFGDLMKRFEELNRIKPARSRRKRRAPSFSRMAAEHHLDYQFNWVPLYHDIEKLRKSIASFARRYNSMVATLNKPIRGHARINLPMPQLENRDAVDSLGQHGKADWSWVLPPQFVLTLKFQRHIQEIPGWGKGLALLDDLGVNLNPAVIWNAIPYSFVVDWFFKVGDFLDQYKWDLYPADVLILDVCHSIKYELAYRSYVTQVGAERRSWDLCHASRSSYTRWPASFMRSLPLQVGTFGLREASLGHSLLEVRRK